MDGWILCKNRMPDEETRGEATISKPCIVELTDGTVTEDWLINHRWVINCKDSGSPYPVKWRYKSEM